jgi:ADP-ribose pyrophosphatase YjhB (NUDIX family)
VFSKAWYARQFGDPLSWRTFVEMNHARLSFYIATMQNDDAAFDYHGALVVVETDEGEIVLIHPLGGPAHAPSSLPSDPCVPGEEPSDAAVRIVKEKTGLEVEVIREFTSFIQEGTPTGTMRAHGFIARITGGALIANGPEGAARSYPVDDMPAIVPIRVANQRTLDEYLRQRNAT